MVRDEAIDQIAQVGLIMRVRRSKRSDIGFGEPGAERALGDAITTGDVAEGLTGQHSGDGFGAELGWLWSAAGYGLEAEPHNGVSRSRARAAQVSRRKAERCHWTSFLRVQRSRARRVSPWVSASWASCSRLTMRTARAWRCSVGQSSSAVVRPG